MNELESRNAVGVPIAHRVIADRLKIEIQRGRYRVGRRLPSTKALATAYGSSHSTLHTALTSLAKEGWLERRHGSGTFIADPKTRFLCAGIYHAVEIGSSDQPAFIRNVHFSLLRELGQLRKKSRVFIDSRPPSDHCRVLPELQQALQRREIQCLIAPTLNSISPPVLARLHTPLAFIWNPESPYRVNFDKGSLFAEAVSILKHQGSSSVALISHVSPADSEYLEVYEAFENAVRREGLISRIEWREKPQHHHSDLERYGYDAFKKLWKMRHKPEGLVVYPDAVARGVILAILEIGAALVTGSIRFVFHKNASIPILCPIPVTWAISDEDELARALIDLIQAQFRGERISPRTIPYKFIDHPLMCPKEENGN